MRDRSVYFRNCMTMQEVTLAKGLTLEESKVAESVATRMLITTGVFAMGEEKGIFWKDGIQFMIRVVQEVVGGRG